MRLTRDQIYERIYLTLALDNKYFGFRPSRCVLICEFSHMQFVLSDVIQFIANFNLLIMNYYEMFDNFNNIQTQQVLIRQFSSQYFYNHKMESDQLEEKQRYLTQQIIDRGYQPEEFMEYCEGNIGNADIQTWTYAQLRNIVKGFLAKKREEDQNNNFKGEGSSFMKYQQEKNYSQEIDVDNFDLNRRPPQQHKVEEQKPSMFAKVVNTVDQMFKNPFGNKSNELKGGDGWVNDMWNTMSTPIVSLNINNYNFNAQNQTAKNDDFDIFGDFSSPTSDMKAQQSKPVSKGIAKPPATSTITSKPVLSKIAAPLKAVVPPIKSAIKAIQPKQNFSIFDLVIDTPTPTTQKSQEQTKPIPTMSQLAATMSQSLYANSSSPATKSAEIDPSSVRLKAKLDGPRIVKEDFFDNISCIKAKVRSVLSQPTLTAQITGHEIAARSYLLPSYVLYTVVTKPLNIQVKRKYTYFEKLRLVLSKFYPGVRLPYLDKSAWISETNPQLIKNQKLTLQKFLNDILMSKELRNCRIVEEFLTLKDKDGLRNKFAQYQKLNLIKSLEEMCLLKGSVDVAYTDQHRIYFQELAPFLQNLNSGVQKYKSLMQKLSTHYAALIKTYTQIEQTFSTMEGNIKHFNSHVNFCECYDLERSIKGISDYYKQLNTNTRIEARILEKEFKPFWNYESNNINTIHDLLDIRTKITDTYTKSYAQNSGRNEYYLNNKKLQQYKHGIGEVSKHPAVLKYQMGFFNQASAEETMRMFNDLSQKINHGIIWMTANRQEERLKELDEFFKGQKRVAVHI